MNLIFLGAPGAGKGTQAAKISEICNIPAISTGQLIRTAVANGSPLGKEFQSYVEKGKLVPDELVVALVQERLTQKDCENGFILDGFPRTLPQAQFLESAHVIIDRVINIVVPDADIVRRMSGRRFCPHCQATYHTVYQKPQVEGKCDLCGTELALRADDSPETVLERLKIYHAQTEPVAGYYREKIATVDGTQSVEAITEEILNVLSHD